MSEQVGQAGGGPLHLGIAEQGKMFALQGRHADALRHYSEAMRMAIEAEAPAIFCRHYLECALESLEHMEAWDDLVAYCERALAVREGQDSDGVVLTRDRAAIFQRFGISLHHLGRTRQALETLEAALVLEDLPLARTLAAWLRSGLHVTARRLRSEQDRTGYFCVRPDTVFPERAVALPQFATPQSHRLESNPVLSRARKSGGQNAG